MMKLSNWMMMEFLPRDKAADKYIVGQDLTNQQAMEIIRIIARSTNFNLDSPWARKDLQIVGSPYRDFITCMVLLIFAGTPNLKWIEAFENVMDADLRDACTDVMYSILGYPDGFYRSVNKKK